MLCGAAFAKSSQGDLPAAIDDRRGGRRARRTARRLGGRGGRIDASGTILVIAG